MLLFTECRACKAAPLDTSDGAIFTETLRWSPEREARQRSTIALCSDCKKSHTLQEVVDRLKEKEAKAVNKK